uniref:Uncharacterized protein n=1 Tax=Brassica oleracea var. oleracea TaxID=109376 RepID=A0A0D3D6L8_BRAOL
MFDPMKCISSFLVPDAKLAGRSKLEVPTVFMAMEVRLAILRKLWHRYGKCAEGIIPMRMPKEDVVLRESSYKRYGMKKHRTFPFPKSEEHDLMHEPVNAIAYLEVDNYYGAKATINVWKPKIQQQHEFTFLQI